MAVEKKWPDDLTFDELVDFAAGHILTELIAGKLRSGVWFALDVATRWRLARCEYCPHRKHVGAPCPVPVLRTTDHPLHDQPFCGCNVHPAVAPTGKVWILVEPQDYQRTNIMGVYTDEVQANADLQTERENLRGSGNDSWAYITLEEVLLP